MADTPNNNIEQQLRDYAERRRVAAGSPEMHPATRQMLQAEVKARFGNADAASVERAGGLRFWPRLAFAFGVIAILGIAAVLLLPPPQKTTRDFSLAKMEEAKSAPVIMGKLADDKADGAQPLMPVAVPAAPAPVTMSASPADSAGREIASDASLRRDNKDIARNEPAKAFKSGVAGNIGKASGGGTASFELDKEKSSSEAVVVQSGAQTEATPLAATSGSAPGQPPVASRVMAKAAAPPASKAGATASIANAKKEATFADADIAGAKLRAAGEIQNNLTQRYRNVVTLGNQNPKQAAALPVLDEFTVAQNGEALTIVDRDGSVYNGYARLAQAEQQMDQRARNLEAEASGALQLVPNSAMGGRGGATFNLNQDAQNRLNEANRVQSQASNIGQGFFVQNAPAQNTIETLNYAIHVEGTNRSLNQRVVLKGNLIQNNGNVFFNNSQTVGNAAQNFRQQQVVPSGNQAIYNFNNAQQAPMMNNFINGRVQLGDNKKADEFNALSVDQ